MALVKSNTCLGCEKVDCCPDFNLCHVTKEIVTTDILAESFSSKVKNWMFYHTPVVYVVPILLDFNRQAVISSHVSNLLTYRDKGEKVKRRLGWVFLFFGGLL